MPKTKVILAYIQWMVGLVTATLIIWPLAIVRGVVIGITAAWETLEE